MSADRAAPGGTLTLYTCPWQGRSPGWHPCGVATKALDEAGHSYEIKVVGGQISMPWTWPSRRRDRSEVKRLSGRHGVPVLVLSGGEVIAGSRRIARWAAEHPAVAGAPPADQITNRVPATPRRSR